MPPAFLFPESDPPPFDLVPEHSSSQTSLNNAFQAPASSENCIEQSVDEAQLKFIHQPQHRPQEAQNTDATDASPTLSMSHQQNQLLAAAEEYTLPDLFTCAQINTFPTSSINSHKEDEASNNNHSDDVVREYTLLCNCFNEFFKSLKFEIITERRHNQHC